MAPIKQIINLSDDLARYLKACGKKSVLQTKPITSTDLKGLRYAPELRSDIFVRKTVTDLFEPSVKINLTRKLKSTFYKPDKLREIFIKYPKVSRRVGTLPPELAKKVRNGSNLDKLDEALTDFARKFTTKGYGVIPTKEEVSALSTRLSEILGETVTVTPIGGGKIGYGYKIATKEKNMFFKCFYDLTSKPSMERAGHGNYAEIASALYSQTRAPNKFIKFYMGKLGEKNDGYMLTEFIEGKATYRKQEFSFKDLIHKFITGDPNPANMRNGRFIDFGMSDPTEYDKMKPLSFKILKRIMIALDEGSVKNIEKIVNSHKGSLEYNEALEKVKDIILRKFNGNIEEFTSRKNMFRKLGLDYKPELKKLVTQQLGKLVPKDTIEKIAQIYGVSVHEIETMRKSSYDLFMSKFTNNSITRG